MNKDIWVYIEQNQGTAASVSLELLNEAVRLKGRMKVPGKVIALIIGDELGQLTETCFRHGAEQVYTAADPRLSLYHPEYYAEIVVRMIQSHDPHIFLFGATCTGSQLAPMTAARVNTGIAAHSIKLKIDEEDHLIAVVPAFGGKVLGDILIPEHRPQMASIKPGILEKAAVLSPGDDLQSKGESEAISLEFLERINVRLQPLRLCREEVRGVPLEEADLVLCGGFGVGDSENWALLQALANKMGGALGCTRPAVDEGWADGEHLMIGTSGKSIRPKVYIGFGISGATHHVCGMKDSAYIININKDANAEIFSVSDLGLVGDLKQILSILQDSN